MASNDDNDVHDLLNDTNWSALDTDDKAQPVASLDVGLDQAIVNQEPDHDLSRSQDPTQSTTRSWTYVKPQTKTKTKTWVRTDPKKRKCSTSPPKVGCNSSFSGKILESTTKRLRLIGNDGNEGTNKEKEDDQRVRLQRELNDRRAKPLVESDHECLINLMEEDDLTEEGNALNDCLMEIEIGGENCV